MINITLIELKKLLNKMEEDVGLTSFSEVEKNVFYAIKDLEKENGFAKTANLLNEFFSEFDFFTNDFLIYSSNVDTLVPTALPFKVSEPLTSKEPVNICESVKVSPNIVEPLAKLCVI